MMMRRLLVVLVAATTLLLAAPAGASGNLGWRLSGWGSADCNQDGAHNVCIRYGPGGSTVDLAFDSWVPWWCAIAWIEDGNAQGTPLRIVWTSIDPNRSCISQAGGWGDGLGNVAGIMGAGWPVQVIDFPLARGTMWVIW